ncbi:MAG: lamin tail domain-containing protein, partial [Limisphaerales bacterium]
AQRLNATGPFLVVDQPIHLKVRAHEDGSWSRPLSGYFVHPELASVVFSEIMYHPSEAQWADSQWREEDLEYLEVLNHGKQEVELGGFSISQGVSYTFGPGVLMPGEVRLIASNPEALAALYPDLKGSIYGPFDGRLANSGETLVLHDAAGRLLDEVAYADKDSWPEQADGEGASLERIEVASTDSSAWFASGSSNGSPGRASSINGIEVQLVRGPDGRLEIRFKSQSPGIHQLMATDQLSPASWQGMEQWESQDSGQEHTFFIQAPIRGHRFFRVHRP